MTERKRTNENTSAPDELIRRERRQIAQLVSALAVVATSGFVTYFMAGHGVWQQWTYLLHTGAGIYLTGILFPYVRIHFRRTLGIRRPAMVILGLASVAIALGVTASGLHITVMGQREAQRWIYEAHIVTACAVLIGIVAHVFGQKIFSPDRRRLAELGWFPSLSTAVLRRPAGALFAASLAVGGMTTLYLLVSADYSTEPAVQPYELPYGDHPFRPSQTETASGTFVDARRIGQSERCAACHGDIARQWQSSMHARAGRDKAYQSSIGLLVANQGMAATRYCEGCHTPGALLTGQLTAGGRLDTRFHEREGTGCLGCHGISRIVHLKGVASYEFSPTDDYLFAYSSSYLATRLHNFLVRIQPRRHRQDMARQPLRTPQMCATCHAQFMDEDMNNWGWVKMQDEFTAWLNSPYSGQGAQTFANRNVTRCQDCHMPLIPGEDPSANGEGMVRAHFIPGSNTAIPWHEGDRAQVKRVTDFLQADRVRVSIERPTRQDTEESDLPIAPDARNNSEAPVYYYLGERVALTVIVTNMGVGHDFPGGTTDINEAWMHLRVVDAQNQVVFESGALRQDNDVDPGAHFYRTLAVNRNGKHVWRHDLFNLVGDSYDKVIPAGASDAIQYGFEIPAWTKSPLTVSATVRYRKFNNRYARWALERPKAELPIVDVAYDDLQLPVRQKPTVQKSQNR